MNNCNPHLIEQDSLLHPTRRNINSRHRQGRRSPSSREHFEFITSVLEEALAISANLESFLPWDGEFTEEETPHQTSMKQ
jgi:hypothetical protein